jgi:integrase
LECPVKRHGPWRSEHSRSSRTAPESERVIGQKRERTPPDASRSNSAWRSGRRSRGELFALDVFTSVNGGPIDPTALLYHFKRLLTKAGLPDFRFHDLRHSCATILVANEVPMKVIQEMLGHSQMATTANTYAHVLPNLRQDAADAMDATFGATGS